MTTSINSVSDLLNKEPVDPKYARRQYSLNTSKNMQSIILGDAELIQPEPLRRRVSGHGRRNLEVSNVCTWHNDLLELERQEQLRADSMMAVNEKILDLALSDKGEDEELGEQRASGEKNEGTQCDDLCFDAKSAGSSVDESEDPEAEEKKEDGEKEKEVVEEEAAKTKKKVVKKDSLLEFQLDECAKEIKSGIRTRRLHGDLSRQYALRDQGSIEDLLYELRRDDFPKPPARQSEGKMKHRMFLNHLWF